MAAVVDRKFQLAAKPIRATGVSQEYTDDGGVRLIVKLHKVWWFKVPAGTTKKYELDEVGRFIWDKCDGKVTLEEMIEAVAERYRLNLREAEVSTLKFFEMLLRKRLIGLAVNKQDK